MKQLMIVALIATVFPGAVAGQQGAAQGAGTGRGTAKPAPAPVRTSAVRISVHDADGANLDGVHLTLSGAAQGDYSTAAAGTAVLPSLKDGLYRIRCEKAGFITLEREFQLHGGALTPVDIVLTAAPPPPPPPPLPPAPTPRKAGISGPPVTLSIPDFLDRNFIGREPIKESVVACQPAETVRLLQLRDNLAEHVHDNVDEVLYVVAGDGALRIGDQTTAIKAGSLAVVPQGSPHALERHGKNPLIMVSTLSGAACQASGQTAAKR